MEKAQATPNYVTSEQLRNEVRYSEEEIRRLRDKIKLLVRILVDKKIIGEELAKSFAETDTNENENKKTADILEWYVDKQKQK